MRFTAAVAIAGLLLGLGGCQPASPPAANGRFLLEDFENDTLWSLDSADNYGEVTFAASHATHGQSAMQLRFYDNGRHKSMFRKEVNYDLSSVTTLWLDAFNHNPGAGVKCSLAFKTAAGGFFETAPRTLAAGWNRDVVYLLDGQGLKDGTDLKRWAAQRDRVTRLMLLVFPGENRQGRLSVDNLRADRLGVNRNPAPALLAFVPPGAARQFQELEWRLTFDAKTLLLPPLEEKNGKPVNAWAGVTVEARFVRPDGKRVTVKGFLKEADDLAAGKVVYAVRFTPTLAGGWHLRLGYISGRQWRWVVDAPFVCPKNADGKGMVGIDPGDPRYFSLQNGEPFYPLGQNICWAADYEPYFKAIRDYGGNLARVWICPWNNPLLELDGSGRINLQSARNLDRIFELARQYGVYVQLVLTYHGWLGSDWGRNPFNQANGGPCALPEDFWINSGARAQFKRYLDYLVSRWAHHQNLFAWELMNETDLTPRYRDEHIVAWHREMGDYLKAIDPYRHLVTTSVVHPERLGEIWRQAAIDFTNSHLYHPDIGQALNGYYVTYARYHKPYLIGEIGRGWRAHEDQVDPEGRHLHHTLWLAWMTPAAGNALPWWWDTYIEPNKLQRHFAALAAFNRGQDRRGRHYRSFRQTLSPKNGREVAVQVLASRQEAFGFVYAPALIAKPEMKLAGNLIEAGHRLVIEGLLAGNYILEIWDTYAGKAISEQEIACQDGRVTISLPASAQDFAFKLKPVKPRDILIRVE